MKSVSKKKQRSLARHNQANASKVLQQAHHLYQQGKLDQAELHYSAILKAQPKHFEAKHMLGILRFQQGRNAEAVELIDEALMVQPDDASALSNLGIVLRKLGRIEEAVMSFDRALSISPDFAEALFNRGNALRDLKRLEDALASYDKALNLKPDYAEAHNNRGLVLVDLKRPEDALASYDKALSLKPKSAEALNNRGNALLDLKLPEKALASYNKALSLCPSYVEALIGRGIALRALRRSEDALASYDMALSLEAGSADALNNRGNALRDLMRPEDALANYGKALKIEPKFAGALVGQGNALVDLKRPEDALASYDKALNLTPDSAEALFNRGLTLLMMGEFAKGWAGYEYRWHRKAASPRKFWSSGRSWYGEDIRGKSIVVYEEQGLGDIIQFSRYLSLLSLLGADVTFLLRRNMHRLLQPLAPSIRLVDSIPNGKNFDFQCALGSLPGSFKTTLNTVPADIPYLIPEAQLVAKWQKHIGEHGFKVGICWQGNPTSAVEIGRSVPLRWFYAVAAVPGVRLISLQKYHGLDQLADLPIEMTIETPGKDFDEGPDAFIDTAAVMSTLDLIITSDTSVAHLAGALGRPVWLVLKLVPDWRWLLNRADSPWYPTMTLYRQNRRDDWATVFDRIATDIAQLIGATVSTPCPPLRIPGSIGELFDKITILEIKAYRVHDAEKLKNIRHELDLLRVLEAQHHPSDTSVTGLVAELKHINETLWDIEDAIRGCERRQEFGAEFVSLARSVYKTNDRRAAIKKQINMLYGSEIVEEKSYAAQSS